MAPLRQLVVALLTLLAPPVHAQAQEQAEYQLGPGDNIRVQVFQNPELTVETRVSENGTITYPLIGVVKVGGMSISAAEQVIARSLVKGRFIERAQVNIVVLKNFGSQVSILGLVNRPGRFPLETLNTRLSEMLAIGGGIAPGGADVAIVTGTRDGKPFRKEVDIAGMFLNKDLSDDFIVTAGDVIYVHRMPMFFIYGEVQKPGSYRVERGMTIRQALAQAGGPTKQGTERGIRVHRHTPAGKIEQIEPELNDRVQTDDVLYVKETLF
jgi:polysaccharide export outer membrane protein